MNSQTVTVNLIPGLCTPAVVRVSQYDVGRPLTFKVLDGTGTASISASATATVTGTKPSGLGFTESGTIAGNTVTLNTTLAMTQERGMIPAEIRFTHTGIVVGTANFILAVEPSPHPEGTTDGTQETMQNLETRLQGQIDSLDSRVDTLEAGQGGGSGLTEGFIHALQELFGAVAIWDSSKLPNPQAKIDDLSEYIGGDDPPSPEITITYSNRVMTISGVSPITGTSFANGILTLT